MGKPMGNGFPLAAVVTTPEVCSLLTALERFAVPCPAALQSAQVEEEEEERRGLSRRGRNGEEK
eukprot:1899815-Rhodomonas_salina.1